MIRKTLLLLLPAMLFCFGSCNTFNNSGLFRQSSSPSGYALRVVKPMRIEVTSALDSRPVAEAFEFLTPYQSGVDSLQRPYVGRSAQYMTVHRPECLLGNWVADAFVAEGGRQGYKPDMGLCNIGGLRSALPKDTVRRGDVLAVAPFENFFTILEMRGADMLKLMENIAAVHGEGVSHSVRLEISKDGQLRSATINGEPIDTARTYIIATIDYLSYGNDKMYALKDAQKCTITTKTVRDVLMDHLRWLDSQGQMASSEIEGRIVEKD